MSNAEILDLLKGISARLGRLELKSGIQSGGPGPDAEEEVAENVLAFDAFRKDKVAAFSAACKKIQLTEMAEQVESGFNGMRTLFDMASKCFKPTSQADLMKYADGMVQQVKASSASKDAARGSKTFNHKMAWSDACQGSFSWTVMPPCPVPKTIQEGAIDAAMFYINKIRKDSPDDADQKKWYQALLQMLKGLKEFTAEYHKAGLDWKAKALGGKDPKDYSSSSSGSAGPPAPAGARGPRGARGVPRGPPPPMPPPAPAAAAAAPKGADSGALFAQIRAVQERQKGGKTAGLRHVKKDAAGKKYAEDDAVKKKKSAAAAKKRFGTGSVTKKAVAVKKDPVRKLAGKKWQIEYQTGVCELSEEELNVKQTVYIYKCTGATIVINGKVNNITLDNCSRTNVVFDATLGSCEIVNSKNVKVQGRKNCNNIAIDKTDGITVYVSRESMDSISIVASKSSEMNVAYPGATDDDDLIERPIPEQYVHTIRNGKLTADVSELYGD
jgi:adenylyl cyclase-associated protein